jgi:hypothetical protein
MDYGHLHCTTFLACTEVTSSFAKVKATSTGKLHNRLPMDVAMAEKHFGKLNVP